MTIRVWSDLKSAGLLDRHGNSGTTFSYDHAASPDRAVSMTMPVRPASWDQSRGLLPIFEMNLPEGYLRDRISRQFSKALGTFDDFDLISVVGRTQMGRLRYTGPDEQPGEDVPFHSIDEILRSRRNGEMFDYLVEQFTQHSGISGVQPKVLIRDNLSDPNTRLSPSFRGATHIVKLWDPREYPELAANEFFCLQAAERAGLRVPPHRLSESGEALVIDRFDLKPDGTYLGMEDFCVLNGKTADRKYDGSYESAVMKRAQQFMGDAQWFRQGPEMFRLIALNCMLRNGDAHLKNFALLYDDVNGRMELAPAYDIVTTTAYIPSDRMALVIDGNGKWPERDKLIELGSRAGLRHHQAAAIIDEVAEAVSATRDEIRTYMKDHPEFREIGERMIASWEDGLAQSLEPGKQISSGATVSAAPSMQGTKIADDRLHAGLTPLALDTAHDKGLLDRTRASLAAKPPEELDALREVTRHRIEEINRTASPPRMMLQERRQLETGLGLLNDLTGRSSGKEQSAMTAVSSIGTKPAGRKM